jgi:hypothetical protein
MPNRATCSLERRRIEISPAKAQRKGRPVVVLGLAVGRLLATPEPIEFMTYK